MIGVIGKILGSDKVIEKGLDLIDSMHTSTEEEIAQKTQSKIGLLAAYAPFKIAQRWLALMFGLTFLGSYILVLAMTISGQGDPDAVTKVRCSHEGDGAVQHQLRNADHSWFLLWRRSR